MTITSILITSVLLVSNNYPEKWSLPLDGEGECISLSGNYEYIGEEVMSKNSASEDMLIINPVLEAILFSRMSILKDKSA